VNIAKCLFLWKSFKLLLVRATEIMHLIMCFFTTVTFGMTNSLAYYFTEAVAEAFVNEQADASFKKIDGIDKWYSVSIYTAHNGHFPGLLKLAKGLQKFHQENGC